MSVSQTDAARTLRARAERRRATPSALADAARNAAHAAWARLAPAGATAWLIGSVAWGGFGERSDIDIVVRGVRG